VLCEKPLGVTVEEALELAELVDKSDRVFQVAHMKRFDAGIQAARDFVKNGMGAMAAYKGWYCDHSHRYTLTDAVQPLIAKSARKRKPAVDPKADLEQYYLLAHGSHLVDTALFLVGGIREVEARFLKRGGIHSWFVDVGFANGTLGHLDLSIGVRMDWHEGFSIYGENGSVLAKTYNPWLFKSSDVDIFREAEVAWTRPLAPDGHFYRRQLEAFADAVLNRTPPPGTTAREGVDVVKTLAAIRQSARTGRSAAVADATGSV
jgi:predicted dehydrogenase